MKHETFIEDYTTRKIVFKFAFEFLLYLSNKYRIFFTEYLQVEEIFGYEVDGDFSIFIIEKNSLKIKRFL